MKIYIAGKITGEPHFKNIFKCAELTLQRHDYTVMNPAELPEGFSQEDYMHICFAMIDVCDAVFLLSNWKDSKGANLEFEYAVNNKIKVYEMSTQCQNLDKLY